MIFNNSKYLEINDFLTSFAKSQKTNPASVIAVTKTHSLNVVNEAINYGLSNFGENRVKEAYEKYNEIKINNQKIKLHMIGALQTNKVKMAIKVFDVFHSLDRESLVLEFLKFTSIIDKKNFFIQINTGTEKQKSGILPNLASEFIQFCIKDIKLNIIGLMCLPPELDNPKPHFLLLKKLALQNNIKYLSMGMSKDYKIAVECGATHIRIGSSLFGERK